MKDDRIEVTFCTHCDALVIDLHSDECPACGGETYPIRKLLKPGVVYRLPNLDPVLTPQSTPQVDRRAPCTLCKGVPEHFVGCHNCDCPIDDSDTMSGCKLLETP